MRCRQFGVSRSSDPSRFFQQKDLQGNPSLCLKPTPQSHISVAWKEPRLRPTFKFTLGRTRWLSRYRSLQPSVKTQVQPAEPMRTDSLELSSGLHMLSVCLSVCVTESFCCTIRFLFLHACLHTCALWRIHQFGQSASPRNPHVSVPA